MVRGRVYLFQYKFHWNLYCLFLLGSVYLVFLAAQEPVHQSPPLSSNVDTLQNVKGGRKR